jgi:hypothetical protein
MQRLELNNNQESNKQESKVVEHLNNAIGSGCPLSLISTSPTLPANCTCKTGTTYKLLTNASTSTTSYYGCQ